jgi:hypothetical protein
VSQRYSGSLELPLVLLVNNVVEGTGLLGCDVGLVFRDVSKEPNKRCSDRLSRFYKFNEFHHNPPTTSRHKRMTHTNCCMYRVVPDDER